MPQHRLYARAPTRKKKNSWSPSVMNPRPANPGLSSQLRMTRELELKGQVPDDFGDYEADFTQLHKVHREHQSEIDARKERVAHLIVRNKYFKPDEKMNFLTFAEKEQIRQLHKDDPEEWPIEKLVESFPATDEIIQKVIRNKWTPANMKRVVSHDASVRETWKLFEEGKLHKLHPDFVEHLKKFSHRSFDSASNAYTNTINDQLQFQFPKPKRSEFKHILKTLPQAEEKPVEIDEEKGVKKAILINGQKSAESLLPPTEGDTYVYGEIRNKKLTKFDDLKRNRKSKKTESDPPKVRQICGPDETVIDLSAEKNLESITNNKRLTKMEREQRTIPEHHGTQSPPLNQIERHAAVKNPSGTGIMVDLTESSQFDATQYVQKYETRTVTVEPTDGRMQVQEYRERIYIPRKLYKRGATYKVRDCFYDDDGDFLYRVPGLEANF